MRVFIWFSGNEIPSIEGNFLPNNFTREFRYCFEVCSICAGKFSGKKLPSIEVNFPFSRKPDEHSHSHGCNVTNKLLCVNDVAFQIAVEAEAHIAVSDPASRQAMQFIKNSIKLLMVCLRLVIGSLIWA